MQPQAAQSPLLSFVVIGKNEGERLTRCLESIQKMHFDLGKTEVIYVDSGSTDDSLARASAFSVRTFLVETQPSAAKARNLGWQAARGSFVFFVDGDTILDPDFVQSALSKFAIPIIGVVRGNVRELFPHHSIYHRVFDVDWNPAPGYIDSCGGIAIMRKSILEEVGGFDENFLAGEEPELCRRIRQRGYKILHIDQLMAMHDLNMPAFGQYWKRCQRTGSAYAQMRARYKDEEDPLWRKESLHNLVKGGGLLLLGAGSILYALYLQAFWPLFILPALLVVLTMRTAWQFREKTDSWLTALLYGFHAHFQHFPMFIGQMAYTFWK